MTRGFSLYLDGARVVAAFAVLLSHLAYEHVSGGAIGWARDLNIGSDAVIVFFVLSGLVIAHTVEAKDRGLGAYAFARMTRLWSVALPAIGLSVALCALGWAAAPDAYAALGSGELVDGALRSVLFTNYLWFSGAHLPGDNPYWSVTYEFWYYAGFAAAFFLKGRVRVYSLAGLALIVGPRILLLAPCWILGVALQRFLARGGAARIGPRGGAARIGPRAAAVLLIAPLLAYAALQALGAPAMLTALTTVLLGGLDPNLALGFSDEFLWNWLLAAFTAAHFLGAARLLANVEAAKAALERPIRWLAARTFSLYLFHAPILQLGAALPGYDPSRPEHVLALAGVILAASFGLAELTERRLPALRVRLRALADTPAVRGLAEALRSRLPTPTPRPSANA